MGYKVLSSYSTLVTKLTIRCRWAVEWWALRGIGWLFGKYSQLFPRWQFRPHKLVIQVQGLYPQWSHTPPHGSGCCWGGPCLTAEPFLFVLRNVPRSNFTWFIHTTFFWLIAFSLKMLLDTSMIFYCYHCSFFFSLFLCPLLSGWYNSGYAAIYDSRQDLTLWLGNETMVIFRTGRLPAIFCYFLSYFLSLTDLCHYFVYFNVFSCFGRLKPILAILLLTTNNI